MKVNIDRHTQEIAELLTKISQLEEKVRELETQLGEAQQWIDSEPDWKDKYNKQYIELTNMFKVSESFLTSLLEAVERHRDIIGMSASVEDQALYREAEEIRKEITK